MIDLKKRGWNGKLNGGINHASVLIAIPIMDALAVVL